VAFDVVATTVRLRVDEWQGATTRVKPRMSMMEGWWYSFRLALRGLARTPAFTVAVVLTLALGLGANATIFTVLDRVLLSPPEHIEDASQVRRISVYGRSPFSGEVIHFTAMSYPDYADLQPVRGFSSVAGYGARTMTLGQGESSERVSAEWATGSYFTLLGVKPLLGRFYSESEDRVGAAEPAVVLGWSYWQRRFGGDRSVLGRRLNIGRGTYTVSGVAPRGFTGVDLAPVDVWLPLHTTGGLEQGAGWEGARRWFWFGAVVRMDRSVPEPATLAEATARYQAGRAEIPNQDRDARVVASTLIQGRGPYASDEAQVTRLLGLVAMLVLLIACANVANLFLARGLQRRRELAVQTALGAGRGRLVQHVVAEAAWLAVAGAALALVVANVVRPALFRILLPEYALAEVHAGRVALFTALLAALTVVLGGLIPALRASRVDPFQALRTARSSPPSSRLRGALLAAQAALSVILLVGAGLFLRSLREANRMELGTDLDAVVLNLELNDGSRSGAGVSRAAFAVLERVRNHPGVASATITTLAPFAGQWGVKVDLPGPDSIPSGFNGPFFYTADRDYFVTLGIRARRGRVFTAADEHPSAQPVVVVNQTMARTVWKSEEAALGQCLLVPRDGEASPPCTQVVGIVADVLPSVSARAANQVYYLPPHHPGLSVDGGQTVIVRLDERRGPALPELVRLAREASPEIRYVEAMPLRASIARQLRAWQLGAALLSAFGLLALIVAGSGLYSVLAFDVAQRRFELGVRAAMGATSMRLIRVVVTRVVAVTVAGIALGLLGAAVLTRFAEALLFRVEPLDPLTYVAAVLILGVSAVAAAALPAWRAMRVDPRVAMTAD
jgi:predicted permease